MGWTKYTLLGLAAMFLLAAIGGVGRCAYRGAARRPSQLDRAGWWLAWRHTVADGRAFYSAIGHQAATWSLPEYRALLANAMAWTIAIDN